MLIAMVETELEKRKAEGKYPAHFRGQSHFFGYVWIVAFSKKIIPSLMLLLCNFADMKEDVAFLLFLILTIAMR